MSEGREETNRREDWLAGCWQLGPAWLLAAQAHGQHRPSRWAAEAVKRQRPPGTARGWRRGLAGPSSPQHKPERSRRPQLCLRIQRYMLVCSLNPLFPQTPGVERPWTTPTPPRDCAEVVGTPGLNTNRLKVEGFLLMGANTPPSGQNWIS